MTITITIATLKWLGLPLFVLSLFALFFGSLPDNERRPVGDALRWLVWPLFLIWLVGMFVWGMVKL